MQKIIKIVLILLGVLGIVFWVLLPGSDVSSSAAMEDTNVNAMFYIAYILLAIPVIAVLLYTFKNLASNPDKLKKSLILIVSFLIVLAISYALSSGTDVNLDKFMEAGIDVDESSSKMVGAGLIAFYILAAVAILSMLLSGVKKILSK
jgi:amino acid transporter